LSSESLHSSHSRVDGKKSVPFVHPRPPEAPSSKLTRRRPRVRSAGSDQAAPTGNEQVYHLRFRMRRDPPAPNYGVGSTSGEILRPSLEREHSSLPYSMFGTPEFLRSTDRTASFKCHLKLHFKNKS